MARTGLGSIAIRIATYPTDGRISSGIMVLEIS
jgi:hypothetical protein